MNKKKNKKIQSRFQYIRFNLCNDNTYPLLGYFEYNSRFRLLTHQIQLTININELNDLSKVSD